MLRGSFVPGRGALVFLSVSFFASWGCANEGTEPGVSDAASQGDGDGDGDGDSNGDGDGDGDGDSNGDGDGDGDGDSGEPKFDVGADPDVPSGGCGEGGGELEFSNIWVANSGQDSVSKINTFTVEEDARYYTHNPGDAGGSPSRTSVNLNGDAAIANRGDAPGNMGASGITMIAAQEEDCVDLNQNGQIDTSSGFNDLLPWGTDECVIWHTPLDLYSNRPVAWTSGDFNEDTCQWENPMVWTGTSNAIDNDGDTTTARVFLLDGADGNIEEEIEIEGWCQGDGRTIYGGAVDSNNDFWFIGAYTNCVGHVRLDDMTYEVIVGGSTPYGTMVDKDDRMWKANGTMSRYDPQAQQWQTQSCGQSCTSLAQGPDGDVWVGGGSNGTYKIIHVDPDTMEILGGISPAELPGLGSPWGLAFDAEGYLWAVEFGSKVYKIDVETAEHWVFQNTNSMYTYSDFSGFGLKNVIGDPG